MGRIVETIRRLLGITSDRRPRLLSEQRARLLQRRDQVCDDLLKVEQQETDLLRQGRESSSPAAKRQIAWQIKQLRDVMVRLETTGRMLGQQAEVLAVHLHNLTLIKEGTSVCLPTARQLAEDAARAESMLEELAESRAMAVAIPTADRVQLSPEEEAILRELDSELEQTPADLPGKREIMAADARVEGLPATGERRQDAEPMAE